MDESTSTYLYQDASLNASHNYLWPSVQAVLNKLPTRGCRIFEAGCGNGAIANLLTQHGYEVFGVDTSKEGIEYARKTYPNINLNYGSVYDDLSARYGKFPIVISLEVIEHLYFPKKYVRTIYSLLENGGVAIISTPYHGYWKNLALAVSGKLDSHFTVLWDHGHIKFWSIKTLRIILEEAGFKNIRFLRVGRVPVLAKSMIAIAHK